MGFFRKLKKGLSKVAKIAKVTAPLWSSFVPGGSIATSLIGRAGKLGGVARTVGSAAQKIQNIRSGIRAGRSRVGALVAAHRLAPSAAGGSMPIGLRRGVLGGIRRKGWHKGNVVLKDVRKGRIRGHKTATEIMGKVIPFRRRRSRSLGQRRAAISARPSRSRRRSRKAGRAS